jgi:hypothetical protein
MEPMTSGVENPHPSARINSRKNLTVSFVVRINQNYPTGLQVAPEHKAIPGAIGRTELFSRAIAIPHFTGQH